MNHKPHIITGGLIGLLLAVPLIAIFYAGDQIIGLPFVPFDLFDWLARVLPGQLLTAGIDAMVSLIIALDLGETSSTAKTLEQLIGIALLLIIGAGVGAAFFGLMNSRDTDDTGSAGMLTGAGVGVLVAIISTSVNFTATVDPLIGAGWILAVFVLWGAYLSRIYQRLLNIGIYAEINAEKLAQLRGETTVEAPASAIQLDRREFIVKVGGATATLTLAGVGAGMLLKGDGGPVSVVRLDEQTGDVMAGQLPVNLPNASASTLPVPGTRLEYTPLEEHYRIDISARPPRLEAEAWVLNVHGLVEQNLAITLDNLRAYAPVEQYITLSCISNRLGGDLISTTKWTGVPFKQLIADWGVSPAATHVHIKSADGFDEYFDLNVAVQDERVILAYAWDDQPLTQAHGFPLRIYIPNRYGMKQPKWITEMEFVDNWDEGYWVRRGWSEAAMVNTTSVIDTVGVNHAYREGEQIYVPIGGMAYSGARGISRVEVQVGDGTWEEAQLRDPISDMTWCLWRYDWPFEEGRFRFRVRCYDGAGILQIERSQGVRPDGATGIHSRTETVVLPEL